jgi:hypothetical protein
MLDIIFKSKEHEEFFRESLRKCKIQDEYHRALFTC